MKETLHYPEPSEYPIRVRRFNIRFGECKAFIQFLYHFSRQIEEIEKQQDTLEASLKELDTIKRKKNPYPDQIRILQNEVAYLQVQMVETQNKRENARHR